MRELFKGILYRFSLCNKLFHSCCFENIKFPEGRIHEDLATTYKLFNHSPKSVYTNYPGYVYRKRENSILTTKYNTKRLEAFTAWEEILSFMSQMYPQLKDEYIAAFVYWTMDNLVYISRDISSKEKEQYISKIIPLLKKYYKEVMNNGKLTLRNKLRLNLVLVKS